uniref:BGLU8 n=1 Tax=Arundo donax TaxID=35708 RepID=A0A0A8ZHM8_ARUDO
MYQEKQHGHIGMNIFIYDFLPFTNSTEDITATERAHGLVLGSTLLWRLPKYNEDKCWLQAAKIL